jgi:ABC-type nitrate/sulfonate/bicarbonate transport system substrate-binding protein
VVVAGAAMLGHQARAETVTIITTGSGNSTDWGTMIAQAKGFFKEGGVEIQSIGAQSTAAALQQVAAGSGNLASGGVTDPLYAIDKGAKIGILRIIMQVPPYTLWAKPTIKSFVDLKKKTIIVGGAKDITRIYLERMLEPNHVNKGDYDLVYAGTTPARYAALTSGGVDAAILLPPSSFKAETAGYSLVGRLSDYVKDLPFTAFAANLDWALAHKPTVAAFLKGYRRGVEWFYEDKNRAEAIQIYMAQSRTAQADAEKTYDYLKSIKAFAVSSEMKPETLATIVKTQADAGEISRADPKLYLNSELSGLDK